MKIRHLLTASLVLAGLLAGVTGASARDQAGSGEIFLLYDRNLEGKTQDQKNQHNQMSDHFEADMIKRLRRAGYTPVPIRSRDHFTPGPGRYLLTIKTVRFNPGSKAARIVVGMGAGACSLDVHFEISGAADDVLLQKDHGRGSSRDWRILCEVLNKDIIADLQATLRTQ